VPGFWELNERLSHNSGDTFEFYTQALRLSVGADQKESAGGLFDEQAHPEAISRRFIRRNPARITIPEITSIV
jgi:hypothetical protein